MVSQSLTKAIPIITPPQRSVIVPRWIRGPRTRTMIVEGIWKMMYVGKKTSVIIFYTN
jgi:hypothetical protein